MTMRFKNKIVVIVWIRLFFWGGGGLVQKFTRTLIHTHKLSIFENLKDILESGETNLGLGTSLNLTYLGTSLKVT